MFLEKSEKFQAEFRQFKQATDLVTDVKVKQTLENLLTQMITEVKELDKNHIELIYQQQSPASVDSSRAKLFETRKKIDKILKDWEALGKSKSKQSS